MGRKLHNGLGIFEFIIFIASVALLIMFFIVGIADIKTTPNGGESIVKTIKFMDLIKGFNISSTTSVLIGSVGISYDYPEEILYWAVFLLPIITGVTVFFPRSLKKIGTSIGLIASVLGLASCIFVTRTFKSIESVSNVKVIGDFLGGSYPIDIVKITVTPSFWFSVIFFIYLGITVLNCLRSITSK